MFADSSIKLHSQSNLFKLIQKLLKSAQCGHGTLLDASGHKHTSRAVLPAGNSIASRTQSVDARNIKPVDMTSPGCSLASGGQDNRLLEQPCSVLNSSFTKNIKHRKHNKHFLRSVQLTGITPSCRPSWHQVQAPSLMRGRCT